MFSILKRAIFLPLFLGFVSVFGQHYQFQQSFYSVEDGLANMLTLAIYQDNRGFVWISDQYGLNRYDGYEFKQFSREKSGLSGDIGVFKMEEDEEGNIWLFNDKLWGYNSTSNWTYDLKVDVFNLNTYKAIPFDEYFEGKAPFKVEDIQNAKIQDPQKRNWIALKDGKLYQYNGQFNKVFENPEVSIQYITVDEKDRIWIGGFNNLIQIDTLGNIAEQLTVPDHIFDIWAGKDQIWIGTLDNKNPKRIWMKMENGKLEPFLFRKDIKPFEIHPNYNYLVDRRKDGVWLIAQDGKMEIFSRKGDWIHTFEEKEGRSLMISQSYARVEEVKNSVLTTSAYGFYNFLIKPHKFQLVHDLARSSDSRGITEDEAGNIYFVNRGLYKWDPQKQEVEVLKKDFFTYEVLYEDGQMWGCLYGRNNPLFHYDIKTNSSRRIPIGQIDFEAFTLWNDNAGERLLIGSGTGLYWLDKKTETYAPFEAYNEFSVLKNSKVTYFHENEEGLWILSYKGLFLMDLEKGIVAHYHSGEKLHPLPYNTLVHLHEDSLGVFWLATRGGGIIRWVPPGALKSKLPTRQFTTLDGLSHNYTYAIYEDDYGKLWIPSDQGLMHFDKGNFEINSYHTDDGLPHREFNYHSHHQAKDGTLYFGGLGGIISFHPKDFEKKEKPTVPFEFTSYRVLDENETKMTDRTELLNGTETIYIQPTDKLLELRFALLDFGDVEQHRFKYRIEGFSDNWRHIEENFIRITSLPYGNYVLAIKGKGANGEWSDSILSLTIIALRPFYWEWWFWTILGILAAAGIYFYVKSRTKWLEGQKLKLEQEVQKRTEKIAHQAEALKVIDRLKSRFFANVTHELQTPITLILAPIKEMLKKGNLSLQHTGHLNKMEKQVNKLLGLVEEILDLSKMEAGKLKLEESKVAFYPLIRRIFGSFVSYAQYRNIEMEMNYEVPEHIVLKLDVKKFEKILNNLLSNALKFTPSSGTVLLTVKDLENQILLKMKDSGLGIEPDDLPHIFDRFYQSKKENVNVKAGGAGIGLSICSEYAKLMGGKLSVESVLGHGSTFKFLLPKKEVFDEAYMVSKNEQIPVISKKHTPKLTGKLHKVLLVEDNKDMSDFIASTLSHIYNISIADNGKTALEKLAVEKDIDLILSDLMMPEMDGFELFERIKAHPKWQNKPFVMLTARVESKDKLFALRIGVDDYLSKPFDVEELLARIDNLLANYELRKDMRKPHSESGVGIQFEVPPSVDAQWLDALEKVVEEHMGDSRLNVSYLAQKMAISERQLRTKIKSNTGLSPGQYLKEARLMKARHLLENKSFETIAEICYTVGFKNPAHFTQVFKERFGCLPSKYLEIESLG